MKAGGVSSTGAAALREAGLAAIVAAALALPLVGLQTVERNGAVVVQTRFGWVAIGVAAAFVGRLVLALWPQHLWQRREPRHVAAGDGRPWRFAGYAAVSFAILL